MRYRKMPVVVEAVQYTDAMRLEDRLPDGVVVVYWPPGHGVEEGDHPTVTTIHGTSVPVVDGDWIIPEPDGVHYYPCKPDIFDATYEPVGEK